MCASLIPHLASTFHRTCQVSQLHLPSMPMRQSIENALQTGELARSLVIRSACSGACRRTGGWSRERALAWSARTHATAAACPPASPASRQLRPKGPTQASAIRAAGYGPGPPWGAFGIHDRPRCRPRVSLSSLPVCRSVYPCRPAGGLSSSRRPSRSSSRAHCDRRGPS